MPPRTHFAGLAPLLLVTVLASACDRGGASAPDNDRLWLVRPDGPGEITRTMTEADLIRRFGAANVVRQDIELGEGDSSPGAVLFSGDSTQRLEIVWKNPVTRSGVELARAMSGASAWSVAPGISIGTTLAELERLNGGPFTIALSEFERGGMITSWRGGRLAPLERGDGTLQIWMEPAQDTTTFGAFELQEGDTERELPSDAPEARRAAMRVSEITLWFADTAQAPAAEAPPAPPPFDQAPPAGISATELVPPGWKVAAQVEGDLTGDGAADVALHLIPEGTDYETGAVAAAPEAGAVLIAVRDGAAFRRAGVATRLLQSHVPQWGLQMEVKDGDLVLNQNFGMSQVVDVTHHLRHDPATGRFWLARRETFAYTRPLNQDTERTVEDYAAGTRIRTTGVVRDGVVDRETTARESIPSVRVWLEQLNESAEEEEPES